MMLISRHMLVVVQTAHIGALYTAFLAMMMAAGVPPMLAAVSLGYNGNLFGSITHYASGQAAIYYGSGYMSLPEVRNAAASGMPFQRETQLLLGCLVGMPDIAGC